MYLIDTSVLVNLFKDKSGILRVQLEGYIKDKVKVVFLTNFTKMELLQGARNEKEWQLLEVYYSF